MNEHPLYKQKNYKSKVILLYAGFIAIMVIVYELAMKETIRLKRSYSEITVKLEQAGQVDLKINELEDRLSSLQTVMGQIYDQPLEIQEALLEKITTYCNEHDLTIREVRPMHTANNLSYRIETSNYIIEGRFIPLLQFLEYLEKDNICGKIVSIEFYKKREIKTKKERLYLSVFLQNIKQTDDEE